jgi:hypothetical protein
LYHKKLEFLKLQSYEEDSKLPKDYIEIQILTIGATALHNDLTSLGSSKYTLYDGL